MFTRRNPSGHRVHARWANLSPPACTAAGLTAFAPALLLRFVAGARFLPLRHTNPRLDRLLITTMRGQSPRQACARELIEPARTRFHRSPVERSASRV